MRNAGIGFISSIVSDTISNSLRVVKTVRQTYATEISYREVVREVIRKDGLMGLFGRGLRTRILANGLQVIKTQQQLPGHIILLFLGCDVQCTLEVLPRTPAEEQRKRVTVKSIITA